MKLENLIEQEKPGGTYAGVRFLDLTKDAIREYTKTNNIPNVVPREKMHTTLLYSRKHLPDYDPAGPYKAMMTGEPKGFEIWQSQPDDDGKISNCLVLCYNCPALVERHKRLMKQHEAEYDFDEYKAHVTFSYDVGDLKTKDLPAFTTPIFIVEEYGENLKTDWAKNNA